MSVKSIFIVEDDPDILELLMHNFSAHKYKVVIEKNGEDALKTIPKILPDIIILDLMLPNMDGYEVCKKIRSNEKTSKIPIIMLTAKSQETDIIIGLELGCDDYMTKPFSVRELLARVKALLRRNNLAETTQNFTKIGEINIDRDNYEVSVGEKVISMTLSEFKILSILLDYPGKVYTREDLLNRLNENKTNIIDRNIDVHIRSLRKKLGPDGQVIQTVRGIGYKCKVNRNYQMY